VKGVLYFLSDVAFWLRSHPVRGALAVCGLVVLVGGGIFAGIKLAGDDTTVVESAPAPEIFITTDEAPEEPADLGFPAFATRNTTRVGGEDSVANAAGVALAAFPAGGAVKGPAAVSLVDSEDWASAIAASSLVADPIGAPVLYTRDGSLDELTQGAIASLSPTGGAASGGKVGGHAVAALWWWRGIPGRCSAALPDDLLGAVSGRSDAAASVC
jgi:hypothetical protein